MTFKEEYIVILDYKKPDGFWVISHELTVFVDVEHGINEKNNHDKARRIAKKQFPGCRIKNVIYA
jgi:hypothetical protein